MLETQQQRRNEIGSCGEVSHVKSLLLHLGPLHLGRIPSPPPFVTRYGSAVALTSCFLLCRRLRPGVLSIDEREIRAHCPSLQHSFARLSVIFSLFVSSRGSVLIAERHFSEPFPAAQPEQR